MEISLVWWNTSLSPVVKKNRSSAEEQKTAVTLIDLFTTRLDFDVISLGEVSSEDILMLQERCDLSAYSVFEGTSAVGRTAFDTCVFFKSNKLTLIGQADITSWEGSSTLKVGQRLDFLLSDLETVLHVFVAHWPSRLWCDENHVDRHRLAVHLRDAVVEALGNGYASHVIVLGDFNDEPFAKSLEGHLLASRDRTLAATRRNLMYNPFWRHMGTAQVHQPGTILGHSPAGSYYYRSDRFTRWRTFDQIIFSSSFLGNSNWHLREEAIQIVDIPPYTELVKSHESKFDHMPVMAVIRKENVDG